MAYHVTLHHHSIARAPVLTASTIAGAKAAGTRRFGDGFNDHEIVVLDDFGEIVARRRIGDKTWR